MMNIAPTNKEKTMNLTYFQDMTLQLILKTETNNNQLVAIMVLRTWFPEPNLIDLLNFVKMYRTEILKLGN